MDLNTATNSTTQRSFGLDLMRAVAICLVLVAHFAKTAETLGFWGVELFFVLSGFLIGQILWRNFNKAEHWGVKHVVNFWSRRWWRTIPNYYLFLVIMLLFNLYVRPPLPSLAELSNFLWFGQNLLSRNHGFYGVSWSLCVEEWFYLLFPIFLFLFSKAGLKRKQSFIVTFMVFFLAAILLRYYLFSQGVDSIRTITLARLDAICYGVAVAYISSVYVLTYKMKLGLFLIGICALVTSAIVTYVNNVPFETLSNDQLMLLVVPLSASLLLPFSLLLERPVGRLLPLTDFIEKLSLWSYSIYLSHIPILFSVYALMDGLRGSIYGNLVSKLVGLALTIFLSGLIFRAFEYPITKMRPKELTT